MSDLIEGAKFYSPKLRATSHKAIMQEFSKAEEIVSEISSESSIEEYADALRQLATHALVPNSVLSLALSHVDDWLDVDAAMEMALAGQRKGGIETIEDDGTILVTGTCSAMMLDMFDVDVARITPAAVESTACQLRAALNKRKKK